ncbi:MAG: MBL fold metallo-hydrolase [Bacteroidales bacterium]|nr:MBL fold metallo-hydrolase [Bacteroidales bacterium]
MKSWKTRSGIKILRMLSGRSNVFLLTNGSENILIDTSPANKWNKLEKKIRDNKIDRIDYLILTHSHFDHAGNAGKIKNKFGCPIILHYAEDYYLQTGDICTPKGTNAFSRFIVNNFALKFSNRLKCDPCLSDILIDKKLDLKIFGFDAYIMHTPGHSPGSLSIIVDDEIAIVGDTMFGFFPGGVFPPYANNISQLINSWGLLLETNSRIFLPSHGGSKTRSQLLRSYNTRRTNLSG